MIALPHILIVEDNEDDYEATERSFRRARFVNPISWCRNGQDALDFLRREGAYANYGEITADLILLDLNMPGLDGRRVLEILKADERFKSIPVVVLTTSSDSKDVEKCYELGASTYIQKPVDFQGLAEAVRTMKDYWFHIAILPQTQIQQPKGNAA
jgi:two-component system, response regulator